MAIFIEMAIVFFLLRCMPSLAASYDIDWSTGTDYSRWAAGKSIKVGDTITFHYGGFHTVNDVSQADYQACTTTTTLSSHAEGNTVFKLDKEGTRYFICSSAGHCQNGMKIAITVAAAAASGGAPALPSIPNANSPPETPLTTNEASFIHRQRKAVVFGIALFGLALLS
ncbi:uclacyanin-2-like [Wolffia australiana]